jgi:imidazolonepropionase-like amidohydrolase
VGGTRVTPLLLTNCHVIPCDGRAPIQDGAVLIEGGAIRAVDRRDALDPLLRDLGEVRTLDLGARWLMPGLMDMHVHLALALPGPTRLLAQLETDMELFVRAYRNALDALEAGVTFIRSVGGPRGVDFAIKRAVNSGQLPGPRIVSSGQAVIVTGGHGSSSEGCIEADGADGFRAATRAQLKAGADHIKLCITGGIAGEHEQIRDSQATYAEMEAACEAAHNAGKKITAHAGSPVAIGQGIKAGLDCIEHGYFLDDQTIELMAARGTYLVPTLSVSRCPDYMRERDCPDWMIEKSLRAGEDHMLAFQDALATGVKIAMGTDMLPTDAYLGTLAVYREIEWMVEGGMRPEQALVASTLTAAELCDVGDRLGSVAAGKLADLIAMPSSPLDDIRSLRGIDVVLKDGEIIRSPSA